MSQIIIAKTNAEFLNQEYGTDYKAFMKSRWSYTDNTWVWMVRLDSKVRNGWRNRIISEDEIWEEYVDVGVPTYADESEKKFRIVASIVEGARGREYRVLGKYAFDFENSTNRRHILRKVSEA